MYPHDSGISVIKFIKRLIQKDCLEGVQDQGKELLLVCLVIAGLIQMWFLTVAAAKWQY